MSKKILITGGRGMVGSQAGFGIALNKKQLDILKSKSIQKAIKIYKPDVILHLAAMTDMSDCENSPKKAYRVNVIGTQNIAKACRENNITLVYLSTCAVFDGKKRTPYKENGKPNPINIYGKTKWQGELAVQNILPDALIIRTGWLFGGGFNIDKKFVNSTFKKMRGGLEVKATADRYGSPTYILDLLHTIEKLINKEAHGVFHVVNRGVASYFDIAKEMKKITKLNSPVIPIKSSEVETKNLKRGKMEVLASSKIKLRSWDKALNEYIETILF